MPPELSGLSFGGNVWSYGSLDAFRNDYELAKNELAENRAEPAPLEKPKNEPVDTGMTRYLGKTGDSELKRVNLDKINLFVEKFKLENDGALPETKSAEKFADLESLGKDIFKDEDVKSVTATLARMLEKKVLAEKCEKTCDTKARLTPEEQDNLKRICSTALQKTLLAAAIDRNGAEIDNNPNLAHALGNRDAVLNTALGVAELLHQGKINDDAVVTLVRDGSLVDLTNDLDVTRMLQNAAIEAKEQFTQEKALLAALKEKGIQENSVEFSAVKNMIEARKAFARVLDFKICEHDPAGKLSDAKFLKRQLQDVKLRLQQFRYDLERCTGQVGKEFGHRSFGFYGIMEKLRRSCSNMRGDRHLEARFKTDADRKTAFVTLRAAERAAGYVLEKIGMGGKSVEDRSLTACATTHEANNAARFNQAVANQRHAWTEYGNKVLDMLQKHGGMRTVATEISVSALMEFGNEDLITAHASIGGFCKTAATIVCNEGGTFTLVLSKTGGIRGGGGVGAAGPTAQVDATGEISHGKETTLPFTSREELIAFCCKNAPKLLQTIPGALVMTDGKTAAREALPRFYGAVGAFCKVGKFLGNALGLRIHKSKNFTEIGFENKMREAGVFKQLDGLLTQRRNAVAASKTVQSVTGVDAKAKVNVDVSAGSVGGSVSVQGEVGGTYKKGEFKSLETAQEAFRFHNAKEMRKGPLKAEFDAFLTYAKKDLSKASNTETIVNALKTLADARPKDGATADEQAKFWSGQVAKLSRKYGEIEAIFLNPKGDTLKSKDDQKLFAHCTRLFAAVNEYVAKVIEETKAELKDVQGAEKAVQRLTIALGEARNQLGVRLARPRVGLDYNVFQSVVQFGKTISLGKTIEFSTSAEVGWNLGTSKTDATGATQATGGDSGEAGLMDKAMAAFKQTFTQTIPNQYKDFGESYLKKLLCLSGRVMGKLSTQIHAGKNEAVQPWMNANALQFDFEIDKPMSPLSLIENMVKLVANTKAKQPENEALLTRLGEATKELAVELAKQAAATALNEVDKSLQKIVTSSPLVTVPMMSLMGGLNKALGFIGVNVGLPTITETQTKGSKLSLRFEDGGFTQCKVSEYVQNVKVMKVKIKGPVNPTGVEVKKTDISRQELTEFETLPSPTLSSLMMRCADLIGANGLETGLVKVKTFLLKNQGATNKILAGLRNCDGTGGSVYKDVNLESMRRDLQKLKDLAASTDEKIPAKLKQAAQGTYAALFKDPDGAWTKAAAKPAEGETDDTRAELMKTLAGSILAGYGILSSAQENG